jgi:hypothetical protein
LKETERRSGRKGKMFEGTSMTSSKEKEKSFAEGNCSGGKSFGGKQSSRGKTHSRTRMSSKETKRKSFGEESSEGRRKTPRGNFLGGSRTGRGKSRKRRDQDHFGSRQAQG